MKLVIWEAGYILGTVSTIELLSTVTTTFYAWE